jgi:hypothetical protein
MQATWVGHATGPYSAQSERRVSKEWVQTPIDGLHLQSQSTAETFLSVNIATKAMRKKSIVMILFLILSFYTL